MSSEIQNRGICDPTKEPINMYSKICTKLNLTVLNKSGSVTYSKIRHPDLSKGLPKMRDTHSSAVLMPNLRPSHAPGC